MYRYKGARGVRGLLRTYLGHYGFRVTFWVRTATYLHAVKLLRPLYWLALAILWRCQLKYGVLIPHDTAIGPGLYIGHCGGIIVHEAATLGVNCSLSHGVTIGKLSRGERIGCPTIGDEVYIGPGAKVLGRIRVGSRAAIGANAVVISDIHEDQVVVGVPARVVSTKGSQGYVTWTDWGQGQV
jgi:serine O-acetyltransferase